MIVDGKVVAVTGAASGIGAALTDEAAARGAAAIAVIDIDDGRAARQVRKLSGRGTRAVAFHCDISDVAAVDRLAAEVTDTLGPPALVCANAGITPAGARVLDADPADLAWIMSVNVVGTWATCRAFGRRMVASDAGAWLLVTGSEHALGVPHVEQGSYTASKHAVLGLCDVLRRELPSHVGISVVCPGLVATDLWRSSTLRPDALGGPTDPAPLAREVLARGMDPAVVGRLAFDGVEAEQFLIATHAHALTYAEARWADVTTAYAALADQGVPPDSYDVAEVVTAVLTDMAGASGATP